ncbi:MAG: hypothetical protein ACOY95_06865 [Pseudomonadota bacterium]
MFPPDLAKLYVEQAGKRYEPSNGTEGEIFMDEWCRTCQRDRAMREGLDIDDCDDNELCTIVAASFRGEAEEWVYGMDGQPMCKAYVPAGDQIPTPRCEHTADMFEDKP